MLLNCRALDFEPDILRVDPESLGNVLAASALLNPRWRGAFYTEPLWLWRDAAFGVSLSDFDAACSIVLLRHAEDQVVRPCVQVTKLAHSFGRQMSAGFGFDPHFLRQTTKSDMERRNAFGLVARWASSLRFQSD